MKKILQENKTLSGLFIGIIGALLAIVCLIYLFNSFAYYSDDYGIDISLDQDYVIMLICSLTLSIYGFYILYAEKNKINSSNVYYISFSIISILLSLYPLGVFFKGLCKKKEFSSIQDYLYIGIIGTVLLLYVLLSYKNYKNKK